MKIKLDRTSLLKLVCLIILIFAMFFGAVELIFLVDLGGIDFAVTFLLIYFASMRDALTYKFRLHKSNLRAALVYLSELYMFKPKIFVSHASAAGILVALTCSIFLACLVWVPLIYVSSGFIV
ncbi:MAG: hypothetical protein COC19_04670 [SAR86 cluster bacterium]|uniref:Uncharacterized protein n=1 Tax=SAR86 cluster bacterium TaxID=2030880 RepID=A0A2A4MNV9_9GAMM|nr:MAG: hypothetical protein COC19_04670 [SAR86 cluster bacterium]